MRLLRSGRDYSVVLVLVVPSALGLSLLVQYSYYMPPGKKLSVRKSVLAIEPEVAFTKLLLPAIVNHPIDWLDTGREVSDSKLRPREILGLIILSKVVSYRTKYEWRIGTDPDMGDGTIVLVESEQKASGIPIEQVYVCARNSDGISLADAALAELQKKESKGLQYTADRSLLILFNDTGQMDIDKFCAGLTGRTYSDIALIGQLNPNTFEYYCGIVNNEGSTDDYIVTIEQRTGSAVVKPII